MTLQDLLGFRRVKYGLKDRLIADASLISIVIDHLKSYIFDDGLDEYSFMNTLI